LKSSKCSFLTSSSATLVPSSGQNGVFFFPSPSFAPLLLFGTRDLSEVASYFWERNIDDVIAFPRSRCRASSPAKCIRRLAPPFPLQSRKIIPFLQLREGPSLRLCLTFLVYAVERKFHVSLFFSRLTNFHGKSFLSSPFFCIMTLENRGNLPWGYALSFFCLSGVFSFFFCWCEPSPPVFDLFPPFFCSWATAFM